MCGCGYSFSISTNVYGSVSSTSFLLLAERPCRPVSGKAYIVNNIFYRLETWTPISNYARTSCGLVGWWLWCSWKYGSLAREYPRCI